ncbi:hypothetical protein LUX57_14685 [Actinomadura madurae]|uniref:hypothetical protein n=1 Tax=Actinomadura madurae TaxID=1993 RepID=UPI0020D224EB|nr:hypothetical protein [Actinomadura madurae]MCP9966200.1 hypothetical protein [Actinomadura madurae]
MPGTACSGSGMGVPVEGGPAGSGFASGTVPDDARRLFTRDGSATSMPKSRSSIRPFPCRWNDSYTRSDGRRTPCTSLSAVTITSASRE